MSSVILRGALHSARQEECEAIIGALLTASASQNVLSETCEMSIMMPSRFMRSTTCLPKSVRPLCAGLSVEESAQSVFTMCVKVM